MGKAGQVKTGESLTGDVWQTDASTWQIGNIQINDPRVTATPEGWSLETRGRTATERSLFETLRDNAGDVEQRERPDGTLEALDTAKQGSSNTYPVFPGSDSEPPRTDRNMLVDSATIEHLSADGQAVTASIDFLAADSRDTVTYSDSQDTTKWEFDFSAGPRIVTDSVHEIGDSGQITVQTILTAAQTEAFETTAAAVAGAVVEDVPDGDELARDTTPNSRQTVTVTSPTGQSDPPLSDGDYLVTTWESVGVGSGGYVVTFDLEGL